MLTWLLQGLFSTSGRLAAILAEWWHSHRIGDYNQCVWSKINHESTVLTWPAGGIRLFCSICMGTKRFIAAVADQTAMISHLLPMCWATRGTLGHVMMWAQFGSQGSFALNWHSSIRHTFSSNIIVDHSDVGGASPVSAASTISSFFI